jgi:hypothetical protein
VHPAPAVFRLLVADAEHEEATAGHEHRPQSVDVGGAVVAVEDVEEPAVEHRVELAVELAQAPGVPAAWACCLSSAL